MGPYLKNWPIYRGPIWEASTGVRRHVLQISYFPKALKVTTGHGVRTYLGVRFGGKIWVQVTFLALFLLNSDFLFLLLLQEFRSRDVVKTLSEVGFEPTPTFVDQNTPVRKSSTLESGALDRSAILTCAFSKKNEDLFTIQNTLGGKP